MIRFVLVVSLAYARRHPGAVMVEPFDAMIAHPAVNRANGPVDPTLMAELDQRDDVYGGY